MCGFIFMNETDLTEEVFEKIKHRGTDDAQIVKDSLGNSFGFHRLAIMDLSISGRQPFGLNGKRLMCNGEIYNFIALRAFLEKQDYQFVSDSDCEVLLPLFETVGFESMVKMLDAEFALVILDENTGEVFAARDPFGIRPMFYAYSNSSHQICFASEAKALIGSCYDVRLFPPGQFYANGAFHVYHDISKVDLIVEEPLSEVCGHLRRKFERAVIKRLHADTPMGYLLSGGLDSSLVCAIASRQLEKPIRTFAIGMDKEKTRLT